jgi:hypothetical protein
MCTWIRRERTEVAMNYVLSKCSHTYTHKKERKSSVHTAGGLNFEVLTFAKKSFYHCTAAFIMLSALSALLLTLLMHSMLVM